MSFSDTSRNRGWAKRRARSLRAARRAAAVISARALACAESLGLVGGRIVRSKPSCARAVLIASAADFARAASARVRRGSATRSARLGGSAVNASRPKRRAWSSPDRTARAASMMCARALDSSWLPWSVNAACAAQSRDITSTSGWAHPTSPGSRPCASSSRAARSASSSSSSSVAHQSEVSSTTPEDAARTTLVCRPRARLRSFAPDLARRRLPGSGGNSGHEALIDGLYSSAAGRGSSRRNRPVSASL